MIEFREIKSNLNRDFVFFFCFCVNVDANVIEFVIVAKHSIQIFLFIYNLFFFNIFFLDALQIYLYL